MVLVEEASEEGEEEVVVAEEGEVEAAVLEVFNIYLTLSIFFSCVGSVSTCWSVGQPDADCPNNGLCINNGCANVCQGQRAW